MLLYIQKQVFKRLRLQIMHYPHKLSFMAVCWQYLTALQSHHTENYRKDSIASSHGNKYKNYGLSAKNARHYIP